MSNRTQSQRVQPTFAPSVKPMSCKSAAETGDLVYLSNTEVNTALVAFNNTTPRPIMGVILEKSSPTDCRVLLRGLIPLTEPQGRLYAAVTGGFTNSPPVTGYLQPLGRSFGDGTLDFNPGMRVKRV